MTAGLNPIMENIHPDDDVVARRQAKGYPPLKPVIDQYCIYLHLEMWLCYLHGLDHAAVVTACALLESTMKAALYLLHHVNARLEFDRAEWDKIDQLEFGNAAGMAKARGLVSKEEWEQLDWFRKYIRTDYMHGATPKWLKEYSADDFVKGDLNTGEVSDAEGTLGDHLVPQRIARLTADRDVCHQVVTGADRLVRVMSANSVAKVEQHKRDHPASTTVKKVEEVLENIQKQGMNVDTVILSDVPTDLTDKKNHPQRQESGAPVNVDVSQGKSPFRDGGGASR